VKPKPTPAAAVDIALDALQSESDRGAAVLAGSLVENALGQFLERYCRTYVGSTVVERLFGPTGPISTFSQRTLVAAAFGLLAKSDYEQLNLVRDIRNHFAHHPLEASFADTEVLAKTKRLRFHALAATDPELRKIGSERMSYLLTCGWLLGRLQGDEDISEHVAKT
jgi:DNA-binding MltR family transcriptional regulator